VQEQTLITETKVGVTTAENLVGEQETPGTETIIDTDTNERAVNFYTVLHDKSKIS